jgi:hypothetical protein
MNCQLQFGAISSGSSLFSTFFLQINTLFLYKHYHFYRIRETVKANLEYLSTDGTEREPVLSALPKPSHHSRLPPLLIFAGQCAPK